MLASIAKTISNIFTPVAYGVAFAFLLTPFYNLVFNFSKKKIFKERKKTVTLSKLIASCLSLLLFISVIAVLLSLLLPQFISSVQSLLKVIPSADVIVDDWVINTFGKNQFILDFILDTVNGAMDEIANWATNDLVPNLTSYAASIGSGVMVAFNSVKNFIIGVVIMVYLLNVKETLSAQAKKACYSFFEIKKANMIVEEVRYVGTVFMQFIIGKIIDSLIIGILTFIILIIVKIPYSLLMSTIVGITNIIPIVGPFIGGAIGAIVLLFVDPVKAFYFIIIIIIVQQFDGNILGPKILGSATGLSSFWILFSILVFGEIFGLVGMIIAVPTFAVIYRYIKRKMDDRLNKKELVSDTEEWKNVDSVDEDTKELKYKGEEK